MLSSPLIYSPSEDLVRAPSEEPSPFVSPSQSPDITCAEANDSATEKADKHGGAGGVTVAREEGDEGDDSSAPRRSSRTLSLHHANELSAGPDRLLLSHEELVQDILKDDHLVCALSPFADLFIRLTYLFSSLHHTPVLVCSFSF